MNMQNLVEREVKLTELDRRAGSVSHYNSIYLFQIYKQDFLTLISRKFK